MLGISPIIKIFVRAAKRPNTKDLEVADRPHITDSAQVQIWQTFPKFLIFAAPISPPYSPNGSNTLFPTEPPLLDPTPTQHPKTRQSPKQTELDRNGPKWIELDILQALWGGGTGGFVGIAGGGVKGKMNTTTLWFRSGQTYKMGLSYRSARTPTIKAVTGTGAIRRGFVQLKRPQFLLQGPRFLLWEHRFPLQALSPYCCPF